MDNNMGIKISFWSDTTDHVMTFWFYKLNLITRNENIQQFDGPVYVSASESYMDNSIIDH